jgi:hypothetical protein
MKFITQLVSAAVVSSLITMSAFAAAAASKDEISPNQGTDSCGLGWQVTKSKTIIGTSTRGTTNAYLSPSWSMTSGTSGCEKHDIAQKDSETVQYVASNYYSIKSDMAQGQGEYLAGLAQLMGCNDAASFGAAAQKNFRSITQGADAFETLQNLRKEVRTSPALAQSCGMTG